MKELPGYPPTTRVLQPAEPVIAESGFWLVQRSFTAQPESRARWVNKPAGRGPGHGLGFDDVTERSRIEQAKKAPKRLFHFGAYEQWFVASPDMVEPLEREAP